MPVLFFVQFVFFSKTFEKHPLSSHLCVSDTMFTFQVGTIQRSEQHKSQGVFFARKRLTAQACIHIYKQSSGLLRAEYTRTVYFPSIHFISASYSVLFCRIF